MPKKAPPPVDTVTLPLLPLRDVVVYPGMVIPLFVGRAQSKEAVTNAMTASKQVLLVTQKTASDDEPEPEEIYSVGTVSSILQLLELPDGTVKLLAEGVTRGRIVEYLPQDTYRQVAVEELESDYGDESEGAEIEALSRTLTADFEQYAKRHKKIVPEAMESLSGISEVSKLADKIAAHMPLPLEQKQEILEILPVAERMSRLLELIGRELSNLSLEKQIRGRVKRQMEKSQREYYLNEQMKAIQQELSDSEDGQGEIEELEEKIKAAGMPEETEKKAQHELGKLRTMPTMSAEATVVRNYLDWVINMPWKKRSRVSRDLAKAEAVLNEDHHGLEKVKERITEYLAVQNRVRKIRGPILCLVGPPGVGKTSLGKSIARATGRKFTRMSLGGMRDEAEIRGHRRTYIGSMPGKIIQNLSRVGVRNPLFLLDEIDKMSMDFRGDPASALLEVLDPEQNHVFNDHYLEVDFDLSDVMFVCTANTLNVPAALRDRMEVIHLSGYTEEEKIRIARNYLLPKQVKHNGLKDKEMRISDASLMHVVRYYTREAGVRNLERELSRICRKTVKQLLVRPRTTRIEIGPKQVEKLLGVRRYRYGLADEHNQVGQANGLAWTEVGGELLRVEATVVPGTGKLLYTGQLGDVMQESIKAAQTVVRSRAAVLGIDPEFHEHNDIHVHVPEGATPKDGPSAGVAITLAIVSALTKIPIRADVAMTGEITLRGEILPIGGLKEKLLAALRGGVVQAIIPKENKKDLVEMPKVVSQDLEISPCQWFDEAMEIALEWQPQPADFPPSKDKKDRRREAAGSASPAVRH